MSDPDCAERRLRRVCELCHACVPRSHRESQPNHPQSRPVSSGVWRVPRVSS